MLISGCGTEGPGLTVLLLTVWLAQQLWSVGWRSWPKVLPVSRLVKTFHSFLKQMNFNKNAC
jgi:hypothetical protein